MNTKKTLVGDSNTKFYLFSVMKTTQQRIHRFLNLAQSLAQNQPQ